MKMNIPSPCQQLHHSDFDKAGIELWVKRDDLIHEQLSGNKWRKLKQNVISAKDKGFKKILTFGGAYSNHIAAVGALAASSDIEIHALIRGEELNENSNSTLKKAFDQGLQLHFLNRSSYKEMKSHTNSNDLDEEWKDCYLIPEGGANEEGVKGCEEIIKELEIHFDFICLSAGTGTTAAGILRSVIDTKVLVFPALKSAEFLEEDILNWQSKPEKKLELLELDTNFHFGGFAKVPTRLIEFTMRIKEQLDIPLDYLYTAKAFFGLIEKVRASYFKEGSKILFYHSGGLQGNQSFDDKY